VNCTAGYTFTLCLIGIYEDDQKSENPKPAGTFLLSKTIVDERRNNIDVYIDFANYFVAPVVGKKRFDDHCCRIPFSKFVTPSDEALALVIFENNYDRWLSMATKGDWKSSTVRPLYTTGGNKSQTPSSTNKKKHKPTAAGISMKATCARCQGWSPEGIKRFNELFDAIVQERSSELGKKFDEDFLAFSNNDLKERTVMKEKSATRMFESCRHDLWNDDDDDDKSVSGLHDMFDLNLESNQNILLDTCLVDNGDADDASEAGLNNAVGV
jgi:hypothetical protein